MVQLSTTVWLTISATSGCDVELHGGAPMTEDIIKFQQPIRDHLLKRLILWEDSNWLITLLDILLIL